VYATFRTKTLCSCFSKMSGERIYSFGPDRERFSTSEWHMSVKIIIYISLNSGSVKRGRMNDYNS
jgi:hypothetical protein